MQQATRVTLHRHMSRKTAVTFETVFLCPRMCSLICTEISHSFMCVTLCQRERERERMCMYAHSEALCTNYRSKISYLRSC